MRVFQTPTTKYEIVFDDSLDNAIVLYRLIWK